MNLPLIDIIRQIERSRKVNKEVLIDAIKAALISASRKNYGAAQDIRVAFNPDTGDLIAFVKKVVVEEVHEPWREVSQEEARAINPQAVLGSEVEQAMAPSDFGRIAAQTAKQVVVQRVRESERTAIYEEFKSRQGELINGVVQRLEQRNIILDLGDTEAILPAREQASRESYQIGDRVKALIVDIRKTSRTPQVIVSRSHPNLIRKLFELEVPEIADGVVEIKAIARECGARTKIAVASRDKNVDPVGACVGVKGSRVQAIVREIRGEKIDVIPYSENVATLLEAALQPAKVAKVEIAATGDQATVVVPDDQLSLAIGKNGQNVRLAAKLTNRRIDIVSEGQRQEVLRKQAEAALAAAAPPLEEIEGIGPKLAEKLKAAGFENVLALRGITAEKLEELPGVGPKTAEKIMAALHAYLPSPEVVKKPTTAAELFAGIGDEAGAPVKEKMMAANDLFAGLDRAAAEAETAEAQAETAGAEAETAETQAGPGPAEAEDEAPVPPEGESPKAGPDASREEGEA
jgi:transcription termination/antitermination protein NusA